MRRILLAAVLLFMTALIGLSPARATDCCEGMRGNIDGSDSDDVDIADLVYLVSFMFQEGPDPACAEEADINGDGVGPDIADLIHLVSYMFQPPSPPPADCPVDLPDSVIVNLAVGNQFISHVTEYEYGGGITDEYDAITLVVEDTVIDDWTWYEIEDDAGTLGGTWTNFFDGAYSYFPDSATSVAMALKYPASAGESYAYYDLTVHVDNVSASVTVPAGTYDCYYYRMEAPIVGTIGKIWAAPNIGIIRAEVYDLYLIWTYLAVEIELISYDFGD